MHDATQTFVVDAVVVSNRRLVVNVVSVEMEMGKKNATSNRI